MSVVFMLWSGWRAVYEPVHVRTLVEQLRHFSPIPLRYVLLSDRDYSATECGVDEVREIPYEPRQLIPARGDANCFRRLRLFDPEYGATFGTEWLLSMDLDSLVLGSLGAMLEAAINPSGFAIARSQVVHERARPYNGGLMALRVGTHADVWERFDWVTSPEECRRTRWIGSDQVWISLQAPGAVTLGHEHGVYFADQPTAAPVFVNFAGPMKPWSKACRRDAPAYFLHYERYRVLADERLEQARAL